MAPFDVESRPRQNDPASGPYGWTSLVATLGRWADETPEKTALKFVDGKADCWISYRELLDETAAVAARLRSADLPKTTVLLLYPSGLDFVIAFLGCLRAGVVPIPVALPTTRGAPAKIEAIAGDAGARAILTTGPQLRRLKKLLGALDGPRVQWIPTDEVACGPEAEAAGEDPVPRARAFIQYSSGTTGTPKGVMVSHSNLVHNLAMLQDAFSLSPADLCVSWLPHHHDMGLIAAILLSLYTGASAVLMDPLDFLLRPVQWLATISEHRATYSGAPNFAYEHCVAAISEADKAGLDLGCWTLATIAAEPIRAQTIDKFGRAFTACGFDPRAFYPGYGLAEATLMVAGGTRGAGPILCSERTSRIAPHALIPSPDGTGAAARLLVSSGRPRAKVALVDPDTLLRCGDGETGEIWVSGESIAQGYWNRPNESLLTFRAHIAGTGEGPFLRTGDLGFLHQGYLYVTGRLKDLVIIRGKNHYPQDIELTAQQSHPGLRADGCAAFSVDAAGEERLAIVQEVDEARIATLDADAALAAIRQAVWRAHDVQVYALSLVRPGRVPRTTSGKMRRGACRALLIDGQLDALAEWRNPAVAS
jgi:acyl-CoA synthetase (AMP-forming)/AMP-acid ligase II